jgi:predicted MFS family arabinose efflux permease
MVVWGGMASIIALALLPQSGGFWSLLIVYLAITVGQAFSIPPANAFAVHEGRTYGMGASMTMFMLAMQLGNGVGPVALGSLADWFGLDYTFYAAAVFMTVGVALFAWLVGIAVKRN